MIPMLLAQPETHCSLVEHPPTRSRLNTSKGKSTKAGWYHKIIKAGNLTMLVAGMVLLMAIAASYLYHEHLTLNTQLTGHIVIIVASTAIKLAYIARCIGRHGLGEKQL